MVAVSNTVILMGLTTIGWKGVHLAELARLAGPGHAAAATGAAAVFGFYGVVILAPLFSLLLAFDIGYGGAFCPFGAVSAAMALLCHDRAAL